MKLILTFNKDNMSTNKSAVFKWGERYPNQPCENIITSCFFMLEPLRGRLAPVHWIILHHKFMDEHFFKSYTQQLTKCFPYTLINVLFFNKYACLCRFWSAVKFSSFSKACSAFNVVGSFLISCLQESQWEWFWSVRWSSTHGREVKIFIS